MSIMGIYIGERCDLYHKNSLPSGLGLIFGIG
jgi:hypothetical protein